MSKFKAYRLQRGDVFECPEGGIEVRNIFTIDSEDNIIFYNDTEFTQRLAFQTSGHRDYRVAPQEYLPGYTTIHYVTDPTDQDVVIEYFELT